MTPDWNAFAVRDWSKRPCLFRNVFPAPLASQEEVLGGLVAATAALREGRRPDIRLFVRHAIHTVDRTRYLATGRDTSLPGLIRRQRSALGAWTCTVIRDYQLYQPSILARLRSFLLPLQDAVGVPENMVNSLFVGDWELTSFGVHIDNDHTFYIPLLGKRSLLLWPPDYAGAAAPEWLAELGGGSTDFERHRQSAMVLEVGAGDVAYWPPGWWHVAEGAGDAAALSLGMGAPGQSLVRDILNQAAQPSPAMHRNAPPAPAALLDQIGALPQAPELTHAVELRWMQHVCGAGFARLPPPPADPALQDGDVLVRTRERMICKEHDGQVHIFCAGYAQQFPAHPSVLEVVQSSRPLTVATANRNETRILQRLVALGVRSVAGTSHG